MKQIADTIPGELLVDNLYVKSLIEQSKNDLSDLDVESLPIVIELRNKLSEMNMKAMNDSAKLNQPKAIPPKTTPTKSTGNGGKKR